MTSYIKRVGDLTDPENFEKAVAEADKNGEHVDIAYMESADDYHASYCPNCGAKVVDK
ncbi:hypothetical protein [Senegalimassilia anaerobia]|uniref:hypothetical protein n=1 Tax=Senegalimassilia anaerobia TaxID=1473216 RepID=UPI002E75DC5E|nr:hypothetical protein [Senegalimassilia anaerobia]MEE0225593.1 hypothetical protein [Senegalimassilia anaerobia]